MAAQRRGSVKVRLQPVNASLEHACRGCVGWCCGWGVSFAGSAWSGVTPAARGLLMGDQVEDLPWLCGGRCAGVLPQAELLTEGFRLSLEWLCVPVAAGE